MRYAISIVSFFRIIDEAFDAGNRNDRQSHSKPIIKVSTHPITISWCMLLFFNYAHIFIVHADFLIPSLHFLDVVNSDTRSMRTLHSLQFANRGENL